MWQLLCFLSLINNVFSQVPLPLNTRVQGTVARGASFAYYVDVPVASSESVQYLKSGIDLVSGYGNYQLRMVYGSGSLFSETWPTGSWWDNGFEMSTERIAGDISGRWYVTVTSCGSCTGGNYTNTSTYALVVNLVDFLTRNQIFLGSVPTITSMLYGSSWTYLYVDVNEATPATLEILMNRTAESGYAQLYLRKGSFPTTATYDYYFPGTSNYWMDQGFVRTKILRTGINYASRWFVGLYGCGSCTNTNPATRAIFGVQASLTRWDHSFDLSSIPLVTSSLWYDGWDVYYYDIPGDTQHIVTLNLLATSPRAWFKIYTRKSQIPDASTYTSMVPSGTTYSDNITATIVPASSDLAGRWYIGIRFCSGCTGSNNTFSGTYQLVATMSSSKEPVNINYFGKTSTPSDVDEDLNPGPGTAVAKIVSVNDLDEQLSVTPTV